MSPTTTTTAVGPYANDPAQEYSMEKGHLLFS